MKTISVCGEDTRKSMNESDSFDLFMADHMINAEEGFLLKLLIDKKNIKVLFAETGKDLVGFLSKLICLPFSTVVAYQSASGATGKLLQSLEKIEDSVAYGAVMRNGEQSLETTGRSFFEYTIMDDLTINPCPTISGFSLLKNHGVHDLGDLEEKTVKVGITEGMQMLTASFCSNEVLTDVFVGKVGKREVVNTVRMNALGGFGGSGWDDGGCYTGIRQITVVYGHCIDSIQVDYDLNGELVQGNKHGGTGGYGTGHVKLQFPEEYLTEVSSHHSPFNWGTPVIRSLSLRTNLRTWGPFGMESGTPFSVSPDGGSILGFHGRSGWYIDSLGFYIAPLNR